MSELWSLISGGIIGGFVGAFLGGFARFFWDNWLPGQLTWRRQQKTERAKFLRQFRDPAMRATVELERRIVSMLTTDNAQYLVEAGREDYFVKSTAFLIAQFFAWSEILRRKASMLDYGEMIERLVAVGQAFAHGTPGLQIFWLDQRELGERLIVPQAEQSDEHLSLGYAAFLDLTATAKGRPACFSRLEEEIRNVVSDVPQERLLRIQHELVDLMTFIDPEAKWFPASERRKLTAPRRRVRPTRRARRRRTDDL